MHPLVQLLGPHARFLAAFLALGFVGLEYAISRRLSPAAYDLRESAASIGVAIGRHLLHVVEAASFALPYAFVYAHRLFTIRLASPLALGALFLATEFLYYWHHRASHRIRWFWASHAVHHSPTRLNFTAAIRLGWTAGLSGAFVFYLPLVWLGFHPLAVAAMLALNLLYQFFIHTELVGPLGPLELVLNTPAHHRVHHACNAACLDRNYGGVLILFDRLFGSFAEAPRHEPLRYGLVSGETSLNPLRIALGESIAMFRDVARAGSWTARLRALFSPP